MIHTIHEALLPKGLTVFCFSWDASAKRVQWSLKSKLGISKHSGRRKPFQTRAAAGHTNPNPFSSQLLQLSPGSAFLSCAHCSGCTEKQILICWMKIGRNMKKKSSFFYNFDEISTIKKYFFPLPNTITIYCNHWKVKDKKQLQQSNWKRNVMEILTWSYRVAGKDFLDWWQVVWIETFWNKSKDFSRFIPG